MGDLNSAICRNIVMYIILVVSKSTAYALVRLRESAGSSGNTQFTHDLGKFSYSIAGAWKGEFC